MYVYRWCFHLVSHTRQVDLQRGHPVSTSATIPECHWSSITSIALGCLLEYNMILNTLVEHWENLKTMLRSSISGQVLSRWREI